MPDPRLPSQLKNLRPWPYDAVRSRHGLAASRLAQCHAQAARRRVHRAQTDQVARRTHAAQVLFTIRNFTKLFDFQLHFPFLVIISHPRTVVLAIVFFTV